MRILIAVPLVGLFLCGFSPAAGLSSPIQQPGSVSVRPRVTNAQPGMPEVKATVDRPKVPVGTEVTFTISPARLVSDSRYRVTLFFGDGTQQVLRQANVSHSYPKAGTFTYSILVEASKPRPTPTPTPSEPLSVKLSVSPQTVEVCRPVSFGAVVSRRQPNVKYRFYFGDGSDSGWQSDAKATHSYRAANNFKAYVDIAIGGNVQTAGSRRETVSVTASRVKSSVELLASPQAIRVRDSVTLAARLKPLSGSARYRFSFGDSSQTVWQASAQTTHRFNKASKYSVQVEAQVANSCTTETLTDTAQIEVTETAKPSVDLRAIPNTVPLGLPVAFQAVPAAASGSARYRFNFGDGSPWTGWTADPLRVHTYSVARSYEVVVEMTSPTGGQTRALAVSDRTRVRITPNLADENRNDNRNDNRGTNNNLSTNDNRGANDNRGGPNNNRSNNQNPNNNRGGSNDNRNSNNNQNPNSNRNSNINQNLNDNRGSNTNQNPNDNRSSNDNQNQNNNRNPNDNQNPNDNRTANDNQNLVGAASLSPSPSAQGTSEPTDWWKYIIILAIVIFAAYQVASYLFAPRPTFVPNYDPGDSKVGGGRPLSIDLQTDVDPNLSGGEFRVDTRGGNLIKAKRTEP